VTHLFPGVIPSTRVDIVEIYFESGVERTDQGQLPVCPCALIKHCAVAHWMAHS
jgi:hypothetical protein